MHHRPREGGALMLGPWFVGDTPTTDLVITVKRDGVTVPLDAYATAEGLIRVPGAEIVPWPAGAVLDTAADTVTLPAPSSSPFTLAGVYAVFVRLTTAAGARETFSAATINVLSLNGWPPTIDEMKTDRRVKLADVRDDEALQQNLDAAVAFVRRVRSDLQYDELDPDQMDKPVPDADVRLGTMRLAARWSDRTRSPDGLISMGEMGTARVTSFDPDIDRLLRIGRHRGPVIA
jgi:hypothetical protein